jgi:sarcosine oxidase, subunit beta
MSDRSDVVVVGGGIMGAALTVHLLEAGARNVRLLERDELFQGTTGAGGGFLAPWTAMSPLHGAESKTLPIERYGMDFYAKLHADGYDIDYRQNGVLWIAASDEAWEMVQQVPWHVADPETFAVEPGKLAEFTKGVANAEGVRGAMFLPSGAQVYTPKVGAAMTEHITNLGGTVNTRRPATAILVSDGRVVGVETPHGRVECDRVAIAAGAWSNQLLEPHGVFLPEVPQITSRIITEDLGLHDKVPVMMLQGIMADEPGGGTVLWVRWHEGGLLWGGMYGTYPRNIFVGRPVPDRLDEVPTDGLIENLRVAANAKFLPALSAPTSIRVKHGAPCYTPDDLALVGPVPQIEGLYVIGGDNELGVTTGPGFGKALADTIVKGSSDLVDLRHWRLDRFDGRYTTPEEVFEAVEMVIAEERL